VKSELILIKQQHPELGHKAAFEMACRSWQVSKPACLLRLSRAAEPQQAAAEEKGGKQEMTREEEMEVAAEAERLCKSLGAVRVKSPPTSLVCTCS
jgi:hypothetical protein